MGNNYKNLYYRKMPVVVILQNTVLKGGFFMRKCEFALNMLRGCVFQVIVKDKFANFWRAYIIK